MEDRDKLILDALIKESERLSADIRGLESMNEKFLGFGITIIGAGLAYGIKEHIVPMFPGLPIALFGVLYMTLDRLRSMMWLGGYKHEVENRINELAQDKIANWERLVCEYRGRKDVIVISVVLSLFILLIAVGAYCIVQTYKNYGACVGHGYVVLFLFMFALLVASTIRQQLAYNKARAVGKKLLSGQL